MVCSVCFKDKPTQVHLNREICRECRIESLVDSVDLFEDFLTLEEAAEKVTHGLLAEAEESPLLKTALEMGGFYGDSNGNDH